MTAKAFITTLPSFQGLDGLPLTGGYVYFGQPDQDPRQYPKTVYYDEALSVPAGSMLRTSLGYMYRNGSPTNVWADGSCSVLVLDSSLRQVNYFGDWAGSGVIADISDVAAITSDITTVAGHVANIDTVAPHVAAIDTVAPHVGNIDTVAPHVGNIDTVAGDITNVDKVAVSVVNINAVAGDLTNIDTVATNIGSINTVANGVQDSTAMNKQFLSESGVAYWHWYHTKKSTVPLAWADYSLSGQVYSDTAMATEQITHGGAVAAARVNYTGLFDADWPNLTGSAWNNANSTDWTANRLDATQRAAGKLVPTAVAGTHNLVKVTATRQVGVTYRAEYKASPSGYTKARLEISSGAFVDVDMSGAGSVTSSTGVLNPSISLSGGVYTIICERVATATSETLAAYVLDAAGATSFTGDGVSGHNFVSLRVLEKTFNHALQATGTKQPTLYIDTSNGITRKGLLFDGVDDFLKVANFDTSRCTGKVTLVMALTQLRVGSTTAGVIMEHGTIATVRGLNATFNNAVSGAFGASFASAASNARVNNGPVASVQRDLIATVVFDPAGATNDDKVRIRINGAEVDETNTTATGTTTTDAFTCLDLYFGMRAGTSLPENFIIRAWALYGETAADTEITAYETTGNLRNGNATTAASSYTLTPQVFSDCGKTVQQSTYIETSPFATVEMLTDATSLTVRFRGDMSAFTNLAAVGLYINGAYFSQQTYSGSGTQTVTFTGLTSGPKLVQLVNGPQSSPTGVNPGGTYIIDITGDRPIQQVFIPRRRILFWGDSIANGQDSSPVHQMAYVMQLRAAAYPTTVSLKGWGSAAMSQFASTATARHTAVRDLLSFRPDTLVICLGTNDYGNAGTRQSAANFGTQYAAVLDDLHTLAPMLNIYCQTPIPRSSEGANTFGDTLTAYRTQISNAVSARSAWSVPPTLIDGTTQITTADLVDGVHPTTAGHTILADSFKSIFLMS